MMSVPRIGYVVKRFPRVSETFIAQEILQLEKSGMFVHVLALVENDRPAKHAWLQEIRAKVEQVRPRSLSATWSELSHRSRTELDQRQGIRDAVALALEHPFARGKRYLCEALAVADAVKRLDLDLLHAHFANRPAWVAMAASAISGSPFSFTAHAKDIYRDTVDKEYWRLLMNRSSFAVTVTAANVDYIKKLVDDTSANKLRLLYNGVEVDDVAVRRLIDRGATPRIGCVARLVEKKGVDTLLDALRFLRDRDLEFECVIVGDGSLAEPLRAQASELGLEGRARFLGATAHESALEVIRQSDVVVLPCRVTADGDRDALPTVLLEALAAGVPCVSTPVGGVPEIVVHGETGLLVSPDDPAALAAAIERLTGDAEMWRRFSTRSRQRAQRLFDRKLTTTRLADWMLELVESRRRLQRVS
jgi:glycosyltransferase involved in cell wall biosynthesis